MRVGNDLEDQAAKRLLSVWLAPLLLIGLTRIRAGHCGPIIGARQVPGYGVQQRLDADVLAARTTENRVNLAAQGLFPEDLANNVACNRSSFEIRTGETVVLVVLGQLIEEAIAPALRLGLHFRWDRFGAERLPFILRVI